MNWKYKIDLKEYFSKYNSTEDIVTKFNLLKDIITKILEEINNIHDKKDELIDNELLNQLIFRFNRLKTNLVEIDATTIDIYDLEDYESLFNNQMNSLFDFGDENNIWISVLI
jgi:hypothetical protein